MKLLLVLSMMLVAVCGKFIVYDDNSIEDHEVRNNAATWAVERHNLYIPMTLRTCDDATCQAVCKALHFAHGKCVSANTCNCY